jgi:esterase/lipase
MSTGGSEDFYYHSSFSPIYEYAFRIYLEKFGKKVEFEHLRDGVISKIPNVPQLYIYSEADDLVPPQDIEAFIELSKKFSKDIHELKFLDSKHVAHFKTHPKQYSERVLSFIEYCTNKVS